MPGIPLKVARIGNSRGVRLPAATLYRYAIGDEVIMEERSDGILLRPVGQATPKLSWDETAREMAAQDDWAEWDLVAFDGLDDMTWPIEAPRRVAEPLPRRAVRQRKAR